MGDVLTEAADSSNVSYAPSNRHLLSSNKPDNDLRSFPTSAKDTHSLIADDVWQNTFQKAANRSHNTTIQRTSHSRLNVCGTALQVRARVVARLVAAVCAYLLDRKCTPISHAKWSVELF